jgi:hypothetical protein
MKFDETTFISVGEQIAQAIAQDDEGRAYCAARERACEEHAPVLLRRSADGLVYKTKMNDAAAAESDSVTREDVLDQAVADSLSSTQQAQWDEWARAHVEVLRVEVELLADDIGQVCGTLEKKVAQLEREITKLRSVVEGSNVTPMRGKTDANAA